MTQPTSPKRARTVHARAAEPPARPRARGNRRTERVASLVVAVLLLALPVCARAGASQIVVALQQEPATLNPVIGTLQTETDVYNLLFDGLFRHDASGALVPDLATRVPTQRNGDVTRDGKTITYHLVSNARWSDGQPVTSRDVQFTWQAIMDSRNNVVNRTGYDYIQSVDTPNATTVVVRLRAPWSPAVEELFSDSIQGAIVPAHVLEHSGDFNHDAFNTAPTGSGPYRLISWNHGGDMTLAANPAYFRGTPAIERIVLRFIPDQNAIGNAVRARDVDLAENLSPATFAQIGNVNGMTPALGPSMAWEHLTFNTAVGPLADVRVRRALCLATDVDALFKKVVHGYGDLGVGLQNPHSPWYDRSLHLCNVDLAAAGRLLDQAGWKRGADGMRQRDGHPLQLTFGTVAGVIDRMQAQVLLQSSWRQIGIDTVVRTYPPATFFAPAQGGGIVYGGKEDVGLFAYFLRSLDPSHTEFLSADSVPPAGINAAFWRNADVTRLESRGVATFDVAQRRRIYDAVQQIVARDVPYLTLRWWESIEMHATSLHGIEPPLVGSVFWNVTHWKRS